MSRRAFEDWIEAVSKKDSDADPMVSKLAREYKAMKTEMRDAGPPAGSSSIEKLEYQVSALNASINFALQHRRPYLVQSGVVEITLHAFNRLQRSSMSHSSYSTERTNYMGVFRFTNTVDLDEDPIFIRAYSEADAREIFKNIIGSVPESLLFVEYLDKLPAGESFLTD